MDKIKNYYDGYNKKIFESITRPPMRCIEIGCANGHLGRALKLRYPNLYYTGVDISKCAILEATKYLDEVIHKDISSIEHEQYLEYFGTKPFDLIILGDVLEHLPKPDAVLKGLLNISAPSTEMRVCVPNMCHISVIERLLTGDFGYDEMGILDNTHMQFYSPSSVAKQLLDTGWLPNLISTYEGILPNTPHISNIIKAASLLGIPREKSISNFSTVQVIFAAKPYKQKFTLNPAIREGLSVIVPVNREWQFQMNALRSPGLREIKAEVIPIYEASSAANAYELGSAQASHPWRLFMHQDVYIPSGCGYIILEKLAHLDKNLLAPAGFIGLEKENYKQNDSSEVSIKGIILDRIYPNSLLENPPSSRAISLDELGIFLHRDSTYKIDHALGWHLWATDLCLQAWEYNGEPCSAIFSVPLFHNSSNLFKLPNEWHDSADILKKKWPKRLPIKTLCGIINESQPVKINTKNHEANRFNAPLSLIYVRLLRRQMKKLFRLH